MTAAVLTWLLNATPDPQRKVHMSPDPALLGVLRDSVNRHGHRLTVLTDCIDLPDDERTVWVRVAPGGNPYFYRWALTADWLDAHPEVDSVWCVDGTDTEMLHDPFPHMEAPALYVGSERDTLGGSVGGWLRQFCPSVAPFLDAHPMLRVLNCGTVGGDRWVVTDLARRLSDAESRGDAWEMGVFQELVYTHYPLHITGPTVHTVLRAEDRQSSAWWRHK